MQRQDEGTSRSPQELILSLLEKQESISSADVCRALRVSKATAVTYIERLITSGELVRTGSGPKTRYKIVGY